MGLLFVCLATGWLSPTIEMTIEGDAAFYAPGLMARVAENRDMDLMGYAGGVALMPCGDLGREVWIRFANGWDGPFLVVDCSQRGHYAMNVRRGRIVDLDRRTWDAHALPEMPVAVRVSFVPPWPRRRWMWRLQ